MTMDFTILVFCADKIIFSSNDVTELQDFTVSSPTYMVFLKDNQFLDPESMIILIANLIRLRFLKDGQSTAVSVSVRAFLQMTS